MTDLESLPKTDSGHVKKRRAMRWLNSLDTPSETELKQSVVPKPNDFSGSKYATEVSDIRITGTAEFVEAMAALLQPLQDLENDETRLELNVQKANDREADELTDNYALYLSVAERG